MTTTPAPLEITDDKLACPLDQDAARSELRSLGRSLDRQVTSRTGATERELDATLLLMKQIHLGIVISLTT
ncbi:hypothetical protein E6W39_10000 [Kitasatospora acidiphila]|uniref:Uncharacterized protein n=1 Tax=Kitasatospora acidiphila TaxID=2567942 RepID=A0A540W0M2_9ACTN|nr:hypothetical protein [Kitasatospora acidiphila]TQF02541.1 hypothetical protein E6W39_10000 [Kitasatospora acidiphila]